MDQQQQAQRARHPRRWVLLAFVQLSIPLPHLRLPPRQPLSGSSTPRLIPRLLPRTVTTATTTLPDRRASGGRRLGGGCSVQMPQEHQSRLCRDESSAALRGDARFSTTMGPAHPHPAASPATLYSRATAVVGMLRHSAEPGPPAGRTSGAGRRSRIFTWREARPRRKSAGSPGSSRTSPERNQRRRADICGTRPGWPGRFLRGQIPSGAGCPFPHSPL